MLGSVANRVAADSGEVEPCGVGTLVSAVLPGIRGIAAFVRADAVGYSMGNNLGVRYHFLDKMPIR
nr:hypothetical protein GCM10017611_73580 [Rhodococcus wratislaviensis]